jgi:hypothetical protein
MDVDPKKMKTMLLKEFHLYTSDDDKHDTSFVPYYLIRIGTTWQILTLHQHNTICGAMDVHANSNPPTIVYNKIATNSIS